MNTLSLFDGISCGRVALERAGISVTKYFASEIDPYAMKISRKNYPDIIQLGCVRAVRQMAECGLFGHVDVLMGGSPCQGFSFAGDQLAFDDPRSVLFWEFVYTLRALQRVNPAIKFLLENVRMKKEHLAVITNFMGVKPVRINSALVSAQNRDRYYWCNWNVSQPADRGIFLRDIIQTDGIGYIKNLGKFYLRNEKAMNLDANYFKGADNHGQRTVIFDGITYRKLTPIECERLQTLPDDYTAGVSNTQRYKCLGNRWNVETIAHIFRRMM